MSAFFSAKFDIEFAKIITKFDFLTTSLCQYTIFLGLFSDNKNGIRLKKFGRCTISIDFSRRHALMECKKYDKDNGCPLMLPNVIHFLVMWSP